MSLASLIEVALGLIFVYYVMSLLTSYITGWFGQFREIRANSLEEILRDALKDEEGLDYLYAHPLIDSLRPRKINPLTGKSSLGRIPKIPVSNFSLAVFDILLPPGDPDVPSATLQNLKAAVAGLPDGTYFKGELSALVNSGVESVSEARALVENWYDHTASKVSALYKQHMQRIAALIAIILVVGFGIDTISIGQAFWTQPLARAAVVEQANSQTDSLSQLMPDGAIIGDSETGEAPTQEEIQQNMETYANASQVLVAELIKLDSLQIPMFWDFNNLPSGAEAWFLKFLGLFLTWIAVVQGAPFWYDILKGIQNIGDSKDSSSKD